MEILDKAKDLFKQLMNYDMKTIIEEGRLKQFEYDYNYTNTKDGVNISASSVFEILFWSLKEGHWGNKVYYFINGFTSSRHSWMSHNF